MNFDDFSRTVNDDPQTVRAIEALIKGAAPKNRPEASSSQKKNRRRQLIGRLRDTELADRQLERIMQGNDLTDINYLAIGLQRARSVGRVVIRQNRRLLGYGTGFLVAPGVLMTNQHVFESIELVRESVVQFQYERDALGRELEPVEFALRTSPEPIISSELDFAIVAVEPIGAGGRTIGEFGWLQLNPTPGKSFLGEFLTIIQHPGGQRKQVCVRENKVLQYVEGTPLVWYQTDTTGGSSGSPAFNTTWDVVALHHKSVPRMDEQGRWLARDGRPWTEDMSDDQVDWIANEGVRVSKIVEFLAKRRPSHPLAQAILSAAESPTLETQTQEPPPATGIRVVKGRDGRTKVLLPVEIDLDMYVDQGLPQPSTHGAKPAPWGAAQDPIATSGATTLAPDDSPASEKVEINTKDYDRRNGYQPDFLGGGLLVPLPKVVGTKFGPALELAPGKSELKYWNYSVVMNADRGLAFFSAGNIKPKEQRGGRDGNAFIRDKRVDEVNKHAQVGEEFYKKQSVLEADERDKNPFDQGHLSRREDLQWGADDVEAKRNGDDSFHFTNCAPQHFAFNQNRKINGLWNRLEVSALQQLSTGDRICVINGPVFDAPESKLDADGTMRLQLKGARKRDRALRGVRIPKLYFKLIAYRKGDAVRAKAFVVSQEDVLKTVKQMAATEASTLSDQELSLYQVKIKDLETLTGLKFGLPTSADTPHAHESAALEGGRLVLGEEELFLGD